MLFQTKLQTFNLLSIGQRGVGKTVFLVGSYNELHEIQPSSAHKLRLDCRDISAQHKLEKIISYITNTSHYPPPTVKITNLDFSLKWPTFWGQRTLCHLHWWEIPGEICDLTNQDYLELVVNSHGCCVFMDAHELIHNEDYFQEQKDIIEMTLVIAETASALTYQLLDDFKYVIALVLTKCDLLNSSSFKELEERLQPLTARLQNVEANYQTFYSYVQILNRKGKTMIEAKGAATPFLWLLWELSQDNNFSWVNHLLNQVNFLLPSALQLQPTLLEVERKLPGNMLGQGKLSSKIAHVRRRLRVARRNFLVLALGILSCLGVLGLLLVK